MGSGNLVGRHTIDAVQVRKTEDVDGAALGRSGEAATDGTRSLAGHDGRGKGWEGGGEGKERTEEEGGSGEGDVHDGQERRK